MVEMKARSECIVRWVPRAVAVAGLFALAGCLFGCALNTSYDQDRHATNIKFRVGIESMSVVHGTASLPADIDIDIGSDLAVAAVKATIGGGIWDAVVTGIGVFHEWLWGK